MTTLDNERAAFLRSICEQPACDTARLVFADWLDERGDREGDRERAEFIRLQIQIARMGQFGPEEARKASNMLRRYRKGAPVMLTAKTPATLLLREAILLFSYARDWFADAIPGGSISNWSPHDPIPYFVLPTGNDFVNLKITRGFVSGISLPIDAFVGEGLPCHHCEEQSPDWETGVVECRRCDCTGILYEPDPAELFLRHPITRVELYDREPEQFGNTREWFWCEVPERPGVLPVGYTLHRDLCKRMGEPKMTPAPAYVFATHKGAVDRLSEVCVEHGRELAKLPPIAKDEPAAV